MQKRLAMAETAGVAQWTHSNSSETRLRGFIRWGCIRTTTSATSATKVTTARSSKVHTTVRCHRSLCVRSSTLHCTARRRTRGYTSSAYACARSPRSTDGTSSSPKSGRKSGHQRWSRSRLRSDECSRNGSGFVNTLAAVRHLWMHPVSTFISFMCVSKLASTNGGRRGQKTSGTTKSDSSIESCSRYRISFGCFSSRRSSSTVSSTNPIESSHDCGKRKLGALASGRRSLFR